MTPVGTPAVLLRAHAYGETSRILRFLTESHGLLSVMARGARGKTGKGSLTLATFASGELTAYVRPHRDLHTMKDFECTRLRSRLGGDVLRFAGASAIGELVVVHAEQEPRPEIFRALELCLDRLEDAPGELVPAACLSGLWQIVAAFGFAPELDACTRCGATPPRSGLGRFDLAAGGILCPSCSESASGPRLGPLARAQVRDLGAGYLSASLSHTRQHLGLISDFVTFHIAQRPLKSLRFLADMLPADEGV
jgi:DNA repair protein RecO (recombination protein O)